MFEEYKHGFCFSNPFFGHGSWHHVVRDVEIAEQRQVAEIRRKQPTDTVRRVDLTELAEVVWHHSLQLVSSHIQIRKTREIADVFLIYK